MIPAVAPPYLDRAVIVTRMARALKGAPEAVLNNRDARMLAYANYGIEIEHPGHRHDNDQAAVASELARRRATGEGQ